MNDALDDRRVSRILSPQSRRFRLHTEHPTLRAARPIPHRGGFTSSRGETQIRGGTGSLWLCVIR
jgi:hypothetical protein